MNKLTRQWFDEVNQDGMIKKEADGPKVYFKKSSADKVAYHNVNSQASSSNILLETTDESDEEDEQVVIDKTQLIRK
jgi:hypothetical protein